MQKFKEIIAGKTKIIHASIFGLLVLLYLCFFLFPKSKTLFYLLPETAKLKTNVINVERDWDNFDSFKQRITRLNSKLDYYERILPSEKEIAALLEFLSFTAKELDVRITEIQPEEREQDTSQNSIYYQVPISLMAECGYHQLGHFISRLENADRFMKISDIRIMANPVRINSHYVRLSVVTYVMKK